MRTSHVAPVLTLMLLRAFAQTPALPSFEVVSIRPYVATPAPAANGKKQMAGGMRMTFSGPRVIANGVTLRSLVIFAYDLKDYEIAESGWPSWSSQRFYVAAKAEGSAALRPDEFRVLFQALLRDQFELKFHRQAKELSGFLLTVAKGGPKMKLSAPDAEPTMSAGGSDHAEETFNAWPMDKLAQQLTFHLHEPVLNGTGLAGRYDFKLIWSDDNSAYPSFFTALQEQLGLKLERHNEPVQIFVVDSASKPSLR
jgi:uncharacterized protein (TIGR03435 family)